MTLHMILLLIIILDALVMFSIDLIQADIVALGVMMALILTGIVPANIAFSGFGSDTAIMIGIIDPDRCPGAHRCRPNHFSANFAPCRQ